MFSAPFLKSKTSHIIFFVYSGLLIFMGRQTNMGITNLDDAFYAQKAKEMLETGSFWVVTFNNLPDFANVPFPLWMMALSFKLFGVSDYSAIFPTAIFGTATVILTYAFAQLLFKDRFVAFFAAFILIFPGYFCDYSRRAMMDITLTFFVTAALFSLLKGKTNPKFYLLFGLSTALAILSKSALGIFPLLIGLSYLIFTKQFKELRSPYFLSGISLALILGSSWYIINWINFGDQFIQRHFHFEILHSIRAGSEKPLYFLGYARDLGQNYWPWLPFAIYGIFVFAKKYFQDNDRNCLFIFLWISVIFLAMSAAKSQYFRYILPIFPALAILVSKTVGDWLSEEKKEKFFSCMVGTLMIVVLFINVTAIEIRQAVSLSSNSVEIRYLAPLVKLNIPENKELMNFRLGNFTPRWSMMFYADRHISDPKRDPRNLLSIIKKNPETTWLTSVKEFRKLENEFPREFYLIQSAGKYAYFTSEQNRKNIRYDLSQL